MQVMRTTRSVDLEALKSHVDRAAIRIAVRDAIMAHARGETICPKSGELLFDEPPGDCHIRFGRMVGSSNFIVKVVTGFYDNPKIGQPAGSGAVMVFSARTGAFEAVIFDEGWLTAWRTAAAGSLASLAMARADGRTIAIVGAGQQAELQAIWHADVFPDAEFVIGARDPLKAAGLARRLGLCGLKARAAETIRDAVAAADIVVTTTPSGAPLFSVDDVRPGTHVTAIGADGQGKQELDPHLLAKASHIATDDHEQCLDHGEFGAAVRLGLVEHGQDTALGQILAARIDRGRQDITVADLTGLAAEDIAMASFFLTALSRAVSAT